MAHKQTVADRIIGDTATLSRMVSAETSDAGLCPRCSGFMVQEWFDDLQRDFYGLHFQGVRCVNCGEILDPLILEHRYQRPEQDLPHLNRSRFSVRA